MSKAGGHTTYDAVAQALRASPCAWLVTGAAGFIGSHLVEALLRLDQRVLGLDNFSTGRRENLAHVESAVTHREWHNFSFMQGDIRSLETCRKACRSVRYVLHQAALASVPGSIEDPITTHESNVTGFLNTMVAAREGDVARLVYAGSSATYGDDPRLLKVEAEIGRALSPYAVTKHVNELYADIFARCYGCDSIGLRYFNVFGPRQDPGGAYAAVIPKWIAGMIHNEPVLINGDGETARDFCYIDNVVRANLLAATVENQAAVNQVYNIALGQKTTLNQIFEMIRSLLEAEFPHVHDLSPVHGDARVGDVRLSQADVEKSVRLLGYRPAFGVREGLAQTIRWYVTEATCVSSTESEGLFLARPDKPAMDFS